MLNRLVTFLARHAVPVTAGSLLVGIFVQPLAALVAPWLLTLALILHAMTLLLLDWGSLAALARRPLLPLVLTAWVLVACPLIAMLIAGVGIPPGDPLYLVLVVGAAAPPMTAVIAFSLLLDGDAPLAASIVMPATLLSPLTMPFMVGLAGAELAITMEDLLARLLLIVGVGTALAWAVRRIAGPARIAARQVPLRAATTLMLCLFGIAAMDGVLPRILETPSDVIEMTLAGFGFCWAFQAVTAAVFWRLKPDRRLTAALSGGYKNILMALAALGPAATPEFRLFAAVVQIPFFVTPMILRRVIWGRGR